MKVHKTDITKDVWVSSSKNHLGLDIIRKLKLNKKNLAGPWM